MAKRNGSSGDSSFNIFRGLARLFNDVGAVGFILVCGVGLLIWWATPEQRKEFIDTWLLFKGQSQIPLGGAAMFFTLLFVFQWYFYHHKIKAMNERIKEISAEKARLQEILTKRHLSSSKK